MVIADTTGTQLTKHQICFKEYIKNLKCNGNSGHNGDRTYSIRYTTTTTTTTTTTNNNNYNNNNNIYYYHYYYCYYYYYYY